MTVITTIGIFVAVAVCPSNVACSGSASIFGSAPPVTPIGKIVSIKIYVGDSDIS
jgi:hypothetical protein